MIHLWNANISTAWHGCIRIPEEESDLMKEPGAHTLTFHQKPNRDMPTVWHGRWFGSHFHPCSLPFFGSSSSFSSSHSSSSEMYTWIWTCCKSLAGYSHFSPKLRQNHFFILTLRLSKSVNVTADSQQEKYWTAVLVFSRRFLFTRQMLCVAN